MASQTPAVIDVEAPADYSGTAVVEELQHIAANLSRQPENADYASLILNPGQAHKVYGFDATRVAMQLTASDTGAFVGVSNAFTGYTGTGFVPGFPIPNYPAGPLILRNLNEVWIYNSTDAALTVSVLTERYSAI